MYVPFAEGVFLVVVSCCVECYRVKMAELSSVFHLQCPGRAMPLTHDGASVSYIRAQYILVTCHTFFSSNLFDISICKMASEEG